MITLCAISLVSLLVIWCLITIKFSHFILKNNENPDLLRLVYYLS